MEGLFRPLLDMYRWALLSVTIGGIVIGVFELAFKRVYAQVLFRTVLHLAAIPLVSFLVHHNTLSEDVFMKHTSMFLISFCLLSVGIIGYCIGIIEIGTIPLTAELSGRMALYCLCIVCSVVLFKNFAFLKYTKSI